MRKIAILLFFILSACSSKYANDPRVGASYYTKFALQHEKGHYYTTNYRKGILLPVNSQVMINKMSSKAIIFTVAKTGEEIQLINVPKHTNENIDEIFSKTFSKSPTNLEKFSSLERGKISQGKIAKGMSKKAVIVAYGYPPYIKTPTLESNEWVYWTSRFDKVNVTFAGGEISKIAD